MKKWYILFVLIVVVCFIIFVFKDDLFGCKWCLDNNKTFIIETKNVFKSAEVRNNQDGGLLFCKDSNENDILNLEGRSDLNYYVEFNNNKITKLIVYDAKLTLVKEDNNGINISDISEKDFNNNYDLSQVRCLD